MRPRRPLGEVLRLDLDQVDVEADQQYRIAGVYSFGRGLFERGPIAGSDTSYKALNRLHRGQLVLSRLKAFEGAIAVVPESFDGWFLSPEFPTFRCDPDQLSERYLSHVCRWRDFWSMLASTSKGIGARRERVHPSALLELELRFPPTDEQRRVSERLDRLSRAAAAVEDHAPRVVERLSALRTALAGQDGERLPLGRLVKPVSRPVTVEPDVEYRLVGCRWYSEGLFERERKAGRDVAASRLYSIHTGDLVYNRLFAWKGSFGLVPDHLDGGTVSAEFPSFLIDSARILPEYLLTVTTSREFLDQVDLRSSGSTPTSRNRLKEGDFLQIEVTVPPIEVQITAVAAMARISQVRDLRVRQRALREALVPAALNETFAELS